MRKASFLLHSIFLCLNFYIPPYKDSVDSFGLDAQAVQKYLFEYCDVEESKKMNICVHSVGSLDWSKDFSPESIDRLIQVFNLHFYSLTNNQNYFYLIHLTCFIEFKNLFQTVYFPKGWYVFVPQSYKETSNFARYEMVEEDKDLIKTPLLKELSFYSNEAISSWIHKPAAFCFVVRRSGIKTLYYPKVPLGDEESFVSNLDVYFKVRFVPRIVRNVLISRIVVNFARFLTTRFFNKKKNE